MKAFSFYHCATGLLTGDVFMTSSDDAIELNTPADHVALEGVYDAACTRIDVATGCVAAEEGRG